MALETTDIERRTNTLAPIQHILTTRDKSPTTTNKLQEKNSLQQVLIVSHCDYPILNNLQSFLSIIEDRNSICDLSKCDS